MGKFLCALGFHKFERIGPMDNYAPLVWVKVCERCAEFQIE